MGNHLVKKILVIYYTQTGQIKKITDSILSVVKESGIEIEYAEICPVPAFPFPWGSDNFFQAFPETVKAIPCKIEPLKNKSNDYDLIILAYQPWYLSISIPVHSFLQSAEAKKLFLNKPVITIIGCRNMWIMAQEKVKKLLADSKANLIGNIVLVDKASNLLSVISIVQWLLKGKKEKYLGIIPEAGVSEKDITNASHFGVPITQAIQSDDFVNLQNKLNSLGAVKIKSDLLFFEKNGSRIFSIWANFILKKGNYGDAKRTIWLRFFKYYLLAALFVITPIISLIYLILSPFIYFLTKKEINYYSQNKLRT